MMHRLELARPPPTRASWIRATTLTNVSVQDGSLALAPRHGPRLKTPETSMGMRMPRSSGNPNIIATALHALTGWDGVAYLDGCGDVGGVNAEGGYTEGAAAGFAPVCALVH